MTLHTVDNSAHFLAICILTFLGHNMKERGSAGDTSETYNINKGERGVLHLQKRVSFITCSKASFVPCLLLISSSKKGLTRRPSDTTP